MVRKKKSNPYEDSDTSTMPIRRSEWLETTDEKGLVVMHQARSTHTVRVMAETEHYRVVKRDGSWRGDDKSQWIAGTLQLIECKAGGGNVVYYQRIGKPRRASRQWKMILAEMENEIQELEHGWERQNRQRGVELLRKATGEQVIEETERTHNERRRQVLTRLERVTGLREVSLDAIEALLDLIEQDLSERLEG
jgi:hypothetical protein